MIRKGEKKAGAKAPVFFVDNGALIKIPAALTRHDEYGGGATTSAVLMVQASPDRTSYISCVHIEPLLMNRWKAVAIHLSMSIVLTVLLLAWLYLVWYPAPYFAAAGANRLILLLIGVDVCIGPLLTLLVVNRNKPRKLLRLDLTVIGLLQVIALGYGVRVITDARPVFIVAEVDRLVMVSAQQLSDADLAKGDKPEFRKRSLAGPVLVGALPPKDVSSGDFAVEVMKTGKDIDRLPEYYVSYDQAIGAVIKHAKPLASLKSATDSQRAYLDQLQAAEPTRRLDALPLQRDGVMYTAIISSVTRRPIAVLPIDSY